MKRPAYTKKRYSVVVIGASAGGGKALQEILHALPADFSKPILVVQHLHPTDEGGFSHNLDREIGLTVVTPYDKQKIEKGFVYVAPANYHLLVERNETFALSTEGKVNWSRPSIDVLFDCVAHVYGEQAIAILLTGANADGAEGLRAIRTAGGLTVAQDPADAEFNVMPQAGIDAGGAELVMPLDGIRKMLKELE